MLRKTILALVAVASIGLLSPTMASARGGMGGHGGGGFRGAGLGLGLGLGLAGAYGAYGYGYGYGPYAYSGYDDGGCYLVRRRIWTPYGWRLRRVQVCG